MLNIYNFIFLTPAVYIPASDLIFRFFFINILAEITVSYFITLILSAKFMQNSVKSFNMCRFFFLMIGRHGAWKELLIDLTLIISKLSSCAIFTMNKIT